jgi:hypothetical protein
LQASRSAETQALWTQLHRIPNKLVLLPRSHSPSRPLAGALASTIKR